MFRITSWPKFLAFLLFCLLFFYCFVVSVMGGLRW
jgi:hypothetical protein